MLSIGGPSEPSGLLWALTTRARVAIAQGEPERAEREAHDELARAADMHARSGVADNGRILAR